MSTWRDCLRLIRSLEARDQARSLCLSGAIMLLLGVALVFLVQRDLPSSGNPLIRLAVSQSTNFETWELDSSIYTFRIKFRMPDGRLYNSRTYAEKIYYDAARSNPDPLLFVEVERINRKPIIRRVTTAQGMFIYDAALAARIIKAENSKTLIAIGHFLFMGTLCFVTAGLISYREKNIRKLLKIAKNNNHSPETTNK